MPSAARGRFGIRVPLAAAALLLILLSVLATLQYRWIGEVSEAERDRLRATAQSAAEDVAADFDREVGRALHHFAGAAEAGSLLAGIFRGYAADSRAPEIVSAIFVARRGAGGAPALERLDPVTGNLAAVPWPPEFEAVAMRIAGHPPLSAPDVAPGDSLHPAPPGSRMRMHRAELEVFDAIPALVIPPGGGPRKRAETTGPPTGPPARDPDDGEGWTIVKLDRPALLSLLANLVRRDFGRASDFDVAVVRAASPGEIVLRSRPGFPPANMPTPDAEVPIFSRYPGIPQPMHPDAGLQDRRARQPPGASTRFAPRLEGRPEGEPDRSVWTLIAQHRSGSLQSAVDAARRRNLAVSGGILLLLGGSIGVLLASAHRARRIALREVEFVAGITHELRTPLAAIRSAGQNLADGVVADPGRVREYGILLEKEGRRLSALIEQTLAYAGIEARQGELRRTPVNLSRVLDQAIEACRPLTKDRSAGVDRDVPADLPPVAGDAAALRTLFENLLSNALKYGGAEGRVEIRARAADGMVEVAISDRGAGIAAADLPHIFEPFYRGSDVASGTVAGSGLGLSLVERIAKRHGGRIRVESAPGRGSTFRVNFPAARASAEAADAAAAEAVS